MSSEASAKNPQGFALADGNESIKPPLKKFKGSLAISSASTNTPETSTYRIDNAIIDHMTDYFYFSRLRPPCSRDPNRQSLSHSIIRLDPLPVTTHSVAIERATWLSDSSPSSCLSHSLHWAEQHP